MVFRGLLIICASMLVGSVAAQSAAPGQASRNDHWDTTPPAARSTGYRADRLLPGSAGTSESPFHFKESAPNGPAYKPPPQANDKAAVMGEQRPWQNGRPPANCAVGPRDPACH
ncbi:MAG: hypothetical protein ABI178_05245 [Rhodanobacter sp.]